MFVCFIIFAVSLPSFSSLTAWVVEISLWDHDAYPGALGIVAAGNMFSLDQLGNLAQTGIAFNPLPTHSWWQCGIFFSLGKEVILSSSRGSEELPCYFPETVNWRFCPPLPPQPSRLMSGPFRVLVEWQIVQYAVCFEWSFPLCRWQRRGLWSPCSGIWAVSESNALPGHFHKSPPHPPLSLWLCILIYFVLPGDFTFFLFWGLPYWSILLYFIHASCLTWEDTNSFSTTIACFIKFMHLSFET